MLNISLDEYNQSSLKMIYDISQINHRQLYNIKYLSKDYHKA